MPTMTKVKELKPKADISAQTGTNNLSGFKGILINAVVTIIIMSIFTVAIVFIFQIMISKINQAQMPVVTDVKSNIFQYYLDDFIINLNNRNEKRYLKVKISLEIPKTKEDEEELKKLSGESEHKSGIDPKTYYNNVMEPYNMPIRDVIISKLSELSAQELSTTTGKERAKDTIKEQLNQVLPEERQVQKINFGEFIIQ